MNSCEKKVALAIKEHGDFWYEYVEDCEHIMLPIKDDKVLDLEILIQQPFDKHSTFGTIYSTYGSPFTDEWEIDSYIEWKDITKEQIKKAKAIWKNL